MATLSNRARDVVIRTVYAENLDNASDQDFANVAHVIDNRTGYSRYPSNPRQVALQKRRGMQGPLMALLGMGGGGYAIASGSFNPNVAALGSMASPRVVGEVSRLAGKATPALETGIRASQAATRNLLKPEAPQSERHLTPSEVREILQRQQGQ